MYCSSRGYRIAFGPGLAGDVICRGVCLLNRIGPSGTDDCVKEVRLLVRAGLCMNMLIVH